MTEAEIGTRHDDRASVLFLHSLAGNAGQWRVQIEHLMPERLALAVDLPGHGVSDGPDDGDYSPGSLAGEIQSVMEALGLAPVVLVGHSYGATVAIALLAAIPRDVSGILLVDPGPDMRGDLPEPIAAFLEALDSDAYERTIVAHYETALAGSRPEVREAVLEALAAAPREAVVGAMASLPSFDPVTPLAEHSGPRLSVIAEQHEGPTALHNVVADLPVRVLSGVSHWLHMDEPEEFNSILDEFLEQVDSA